MVKKSNRKQLTRMRHDDIVFSMKRHLLLVCTCLLLCSCGVQYPDALLGKPIGGIALKKDIRPDRAFDDAVAISVVTLDGCEYLMWHDQYNDPMITHKGNCKFCIERNKNDKNL